MKFFIFIVFLAFFIIVAALYRPREGFDVNDISKMLNTNTSSSQQQPINVADLLSSLTQPSTQSSNPATQSSNPATQSSNPATQSSNPATLPGTSLQGIINSIPVGPSTQKTSSVYDPLAYTNWNPTIPRVDSTPPPPVPTQAHPSFTIPLFSCPTCPQTVAGTPTPTPTPTPGCPYSSPPKFNSALPKGVSEDQIPDCFKDKYILKTEIVPPVCPACPACNAYPAPTTPLATTPRATCTCNNSSSVTTPNPSVPFITTKPNPNVTSSPGQSSDPSRSDPSITNIALNATPNPRLQGINTSQGEDPSYQSKMNSNYGTSFDNYPSQTPMPQTSTSQNFSQSYSQSQYQSQPQYQMPPQNPFKYNTTSQDDSPWPMPILNDFSKFGS